LWLRGRPGAGKSVLTARVVHDLRSSGVDCCFFFFKRGDSTKSTANAFLRSIAWQMAMLHPAIMAKAKEVMADGKGDTADMIDANPVWRALFVSAILKVRLNRSQFWVIDAMDECKGGAELMAFLARIQEQWPLSVLVTSRDPVEAYLSHANRHMDIRSDFISDEDTKRDIALFLKSNMELHRFHVSQRWDSREDRAAHIVENSGGCFLWASVICSELRQVTSEREIEEVLASVPSDMDALYSRILSDMANARFGRDLAKAFIAWTTYAFRPLYTAEIKEAVEVDTDDRLDHVETAISKCCGSLMYVDSHRKVRLIHTTARDFLTKKGVESEFIVTKAEGHRRLAVVCLEFLLQADKKGARSRRPGTDPRSAPSAPAPSSSPFESFTNYASTYLFQHISQIHSTDDELLIMLSKCLASPSLLSWIEFVAAHGDLATVYQAGKIINSLLTRRAQHSPPVGLARGSQKLAMLGQWGDDLIHVVTKFSRWLRSSPRCVNIMAPFCPPGSAIRKQHSSTSRGISVEGLSARGWDDCLTTITYPRGTKPNAIAAGPGFFAVGMMAREGRVILYDDAIFQEAHVLLHSEPVWRLAFSESGQYLASAGAKHVRIWSPADGTELASFRITSLCISLAFETDDSVLRVATRQNELIEWDVQGECLCQDDPVSWTTDLEETIQFRTPTMAALDSATGLMVIIYRGENIVLWEYADDRIYDVYEKETGSVAVYGSHKLAEGATNVRAVAFSRAIDTNRLAATYTDGDLVLYNTATGEATEFVEGANTMLLSAAPDGRTLAGGDSRGNLTLFEFETLRPLYRVQFDTQEIPKVLAFTADSRRFAEIRGDQLRVWEPSVLLRSDAVDEENSDTVSVVTGPQEIDFTTAVPVGISAVYCCAGSGTVFVAMEDGAVHAHDVSAKMASQQLFVQTAGCPVHLLAFDEATSTLACADLSARVVARKVVRRQAPRQQAAWNVPDELLADVHSQAQGQVQQVLVSGLHSRLLVSTKRTVTLWPVPRRSEDVHAARMEACGGARWLVHPSRTDQLICLDTRGVGVFSWESLELLRVVPLSTDDQFERLVPLLGSQYFATVSRAADESKRTLIQLWDSKDLEDPSSSSPITHASQLNGLSSTVELVVGVYGSRLVVYTADFWIASVDLTGSSADTFVRHFFVPADWVSSVHKPIIGVGRLGEVMFAKRAELAVIKRGLEVTESGERFNARRGSSQLRPGVAAGRRASSADSRPRNGPPLRR
ncbi:MAG: hypothetical protein IMZ46_05430, partial [Acidobacteria bacterium]|nr:hypothetical protein [Acidobacteriota bacterium]